MKKAILLLFITLIFLSIGNVSAQITEQQQVIIGAISRHIGVNVKDNTTKSAIPGATVELVIAKGDTLRKITNSNGHALFQLGGSKSDSLTIQVSYVGYKTLRERFKQQHVGYYDALMHIDSIKISTIIVRGNQIAMVQRGDTTIYNASAFNTMRGDPLDALVKKLPGLENRNGTLYANGEKVSMVLVNGNMLFGRNISDALRLIRSDEVDKVKVYDEFAQDRLDKADTLDQRKVRVLDVKTKRRMNRVVNLELAASYGHYIGEQGFSDNNIASASVVFNRFAEKKPTLGASIYAGKNRKEDNLSWDNSLRALFGPTPTPYRGVAANLKFEKSTFNQHNLQFAINQNEDINGSRDIYTPTDEYNERNTTTENKSKINKIQAEYRMQYGKMFASRDMFSLTGVASYDHIRNDIFNSISNIVDSRITASDMHKFDKNNNYNLLINSDYRHRFKKKPRRNLSFSLYLNARNGNGDGWRVDTLPTSTSQQWLTDERSERKLSTYASISYVEPISKRWSFASSYRFDGSIEQSERLSWDQLLMQTDKVNTHDYNDDRIHNNVNINFLYISKNRALHLGVGGFFNHQHVIFRERIPSETRSNSNFWIITPRYNLLYTKGNIRAETAYHVQMMAPSAYQLRGVIDDSSPLYLIAGNPNLNRSVQRSFQSSFNYTDTKSASSLNVANTITLYQDAIANRVFFYQDETFLPAYDYTVPAGTTLSMPVNAGNNISSNTLIAYSIYSNALKSNIRFHVGHNFSRSPYLIEDRTQINSSHSIPFDIYFESAFSEVIELSISACALRGWNYTDKELIYKDFRVMTQGSLRINFLKRLWLNCTGGYEYFDTDREGLNNKYFKLDASLGCTFGKDDAGKVSITCNDLLNEDNSYLVSATENYIHEAWSSIFGRSITLSLSYRFGKR